MKSIQDTLKIIRDITNAIPDKVYLALAGGYAAVLHGVERTTLDIDVCVYSDLIRSSNSKGFFTLLKQHIPRDYERKFLCQINKIPNLTDAFTFWPSAEIGTLSGIWTPSCTLVFWQFSEIRHFNCESSNWH